MKKLIRRLIFLLIVAGLLYYKADTVKFLWKEATFYLHEHTETELKGKQ